MVVAMKKLLATIGLAAALGVGAVALNSVIPASASSLKVDAATAAAEGAQCSNKTTPKDVLDKLVQDGTINSDQETKILDALKAAHQSNTAGGQNGTKAGAAGAKGSLRFRAVQGALKVSADKIGVSVDDLKTAIKGGQSVADVANAHNVAPADVQQAIVDAASSKVDEAVTNGKLTDQQSTAIKARLPQLADRFVNHKGTQSC